MATTIDPTALAALRDLARRGADDVAEQMTHETDYSDQDRAQHAASVTAAFALLDQLAPCRTCGQVPEFRDFDGTCLSHRAPCTRCGNPAMADQACPNARGLCVDCCGCEH